MNAAGFKRFAVRMARHANWMAVLLVQLGEPERAHVWRVRRAAHMADARRAARGATE